MDYAIVMYDSVIIANRAIRLLKGKCTYLKIVQVPSGVGYSGCHFALKCKLNELSTVIDVSKENKIKIKRVFKEEIKNGKKVYVEL